MAKRYFDMAANRGKADPIEVHALPAATTENPFLPPAYRAILDREEPPRTAGGFLVHSDGSPIMLCGMPVKVSVALPPDSFAIHSPNGDIVLSRRGRIGVMKARSEES